MKESIYTIPISEVFEPKKGCPLCALHSALESRWVQYITGAAMMEPDIRLKTNEEGLCDRHLGAMIDQRNRLSVALLLQTRLEYALQHLEPEPKRVLGRKKAFARDSCFVCNRVDTELRRLAGNLTAVWCREESFRQLYAEQEYLCLPHYNLLANAADELHGQNRTLFLRQSAELAKRGLKPVKEDIDAFCRLFDHRNSGAERPDERVANAIDRARERLCGSKDL